MERVSPREQEKESAPSVLSEIQNRVAKSLHNYESLEQSDAHRSLRRDEQAEMSLNELAEAGRLRVGIVVDSLHEATVERKEVLKELRQTLKEQTDDAAEAERDARKSTEEANALLDGLDEHAVMDNVEAIETLHSRTQDVGVMVLEMARSAAAQLRPLQARMKAEIGNARARVEELEEELTQSRAIHETLEKQIEAKDLELTAARQVRPWRPALLRLAPPPPPPRLSISLPPASPHRTVPSPSPPPHR